MLIGNINVGERSRPAIDRPMRWTSAGVSSAGIVTQKDYGKAEQELELTLLYKTEALKDQLKSYLMDTVKPFGNILITPTSGDSMEIGATTQTEFVFLSFEATYVNGPLWNIKIVVRKYS